MIEPHPAISKATAQNTGEEVLASWAIMHRLDACELLNLSDMPITHLA